MGPFVVPRTSFSFTNGFFGGGREWKDSGFIGFKFNGGAGVQYGWVRLSVLFGSDGNIRTFSFILHDYAYADPGEPLKAGQISSDNDAVDENSLGGLALGAVGLIAWRKSRSQTAP
jgi:hypothetical protein